MSGGVGNWAYQRPTSPVTDPDQRYYRAADFGGYSMLRTNAGIRLQLARWDSDGHAVLRVMGDSFTASAALSTAELRTLRDAINDALADITIGRAIAAPAPRAAA